MYTNGTYHSTSARQIAVAARIEFSHHRGVGFCQYQKIQCMWCPSGHCLYYFSENTKEKLPAVLRTGEHSNGLAK